MSHSPEGPGYGGKQFVTVADLETTRPWLTSYPADVPHSIEYPEAAVGDILDDVARQFPKAHAVVFQGEVLTWSEIHELSTRFATSLRRLGVAKGDRVALLLPNVPHFVIAYYGILKLGAVVVAINPLFAPHEIAAHIKKTDSCVVLTLDVLYERLADLGESGPVQHVIVGNALDLMTARVRLAAGVVAKMDVWASRLNRIHPLIGSGTARLLVRVEMLHHDLKRIREAPKPKATIPFSTTVHKFRNLLTRARTEAIKVDVDPRELAALLYTTGTTGTPKAAMLSHRNLVANAYQIRFWFPEFEVGNETILAALPFFHAYGLTLVMNAGLALAARSILIPRPIMTDIFEAVQAFKPTALPGVPALFVSMVNSERVIDYDLHSIRVCVSGGAPLPIEVAEKFHSITGGYLYEGYGLTEASPLTHAQLSDKSAPLGSIGVPVADTEAKLVGDDGHEVAVGEPGELAVRGPQIMMGYWKEPEETAKVLRDGWLFTGDVARMDHRGFFYIVDRKKDLIITGGENIAPREVEEAIYRNPNVSEAVVAGIPHEMGGEIAKAFIVLKPGCTVTSAEMKRWLSHELAHYKIPREIEFRDELPKSAMGKVLRRPLVLEEIERRKTKSSRRRQKHAQSRDEAGD
jgi:long-chain acyl-CoA synthetase